MAERIALTTADGVNLIGTWSHAPTVHGAAVLLHAMPETRASWITLQAVLAKHEIASLAIDLRGHGESIQTVEGEKLDYRSFTDEEHQGSLWDVMAAVEWVRKRGLDRERIVLGGASIGANLAVKMLAEEPLLAGAFLLSSGGDYHGLKVLEDAQALLPEQQLLIVSAEDDPQSFPDSKKLYESAPVEQKQFLPYAAGGHGTHLLKADPSLIEKIAGWTKNAIRG